MSRGTAAGSRSRSPAALTPTDSIIARNTRGGMLHPPAAGARERSLWAQRDDPQAPGLGVCRAGAPRGLPKLLPCGASGGRAPWVRLTETRAALDSLAYRDGIIAKRRMADYVWLQVARLGLQISRILLGFLLSRFQWADP